MDDFDRAFEYTIKNEGTIFVDDPDDRGGATKYGITLRTMQEFLNHHVTKDDVRLMSLATAKEIYRRLYWLPYLPQIGPRAVALFDCRVLIGQTNLTRITPKMAFSTKEFIEDLVHNLKSHFTTIVRHAPSQAKFLPGWNRRADRLLTLVPQQ